MGRKIREFAKNLKICLKTGALFIHKNVTFLSNPGSYFRLKKGRSLTKKGNPGPF